MQSWQQFLLQTTTPRLSKWSSNTSARLEYNPTCTAMCPLLLSSLQSSVLLICQSLIILLVLLYVDTDTMRSQQRSEHVQDCHCSGRWHRIRRKDGHQHDSLFSTHAPRNTWQIEKFARIASCIPTHSLRRSSTSTHRPKAEYKRVRYSLN